MEFGEIMLTEAVMNKAAAEAQKEAKKAEVAGARVRGPRIYKAVKLVSDVPVDLYGEEKTGERPRDIPSAVKAAGITGMSGGGFDASVKMETVIRSKAAKKYLVVNAAECDPGLVHDSWLLKNRTDIVAAGIEAAATVAHFDRCVLASKFPVNVGSAENIVIDAGYPLGEEHFLIRRVLGIELDAQSIPAEKGILVMNLQTVFAVGLIALGRDVRGRYLTAADIATGRARVVRAEYGTPIGDVFEAALGKASGRLYTGSGIMNAYPANAADAVSPLTNFICRAERVEYSGPEACTGCGKCARMCPAGIPVPGVLRTWEISEKKTLPLLIHRLKYKNTKADAADACVFCRACTFVCDAGMDVLGLLMQKRERH